MSMRKYLIKCLIRPVVLSGALVVVAALVAGCGGATAAAGSTGASASATPTCAPTPAFASVAGTIASVSGSTLTINAVSGTSTQVTVSSTTRVTKLMTAKPADLTSGTRVQVMTDPATTTAQRILVLPAGIGAGTGAGTGAGGFPRAGATGTPGARFNRNCLRQNGQGAGTGQGFGQGARGGLTGTVDSASSTQLVVNDTQGQSFTLAITPTTLIETSAVGQVSDLTTGARVQVTGAKTAAGITARSIVVES